MTLFSLPDDQIAIRDMARVFAAERIEPRAVEWDGKKHFPVEALRQAAELGMAGLYVRDDVGGSALTRLDSVVVFEALSGGCPTTAAFLSIHNMCA